MSSSDRVQEYHPHRLGEYVLLSDKAKVRINPCVKIVISFFRFSYFFPHPLATSSNSTLSPEHSYPPLPRRGTWVLCTPRWGTGPPATSTPITPRARCRRQGGHPVPGQVWTIGSTETTWSLRLNKLSDEEEFTCPLDTPLDK